MAAALAGGAAVVALAGALVPPFAGRVGDTVSDVSRYRLVVWRTSLGMIAARPLLGTGFGTFQTAYDRVKPAQAMPEPFAYDLALNIAVETGLLGLLAALWVASAAGREWTKQGQRARAGPGDGAGAPGAVWFRAIVPALWIGLLVDQLADNTLFSISTSAALWFLLALTVASSLNEARGLAPTGRAAGTR
jgi:O-antigen ligase